MIFVCLAASLCEMPELRHSPRAQRRIAFRNLLREFVGLVRVGGRECPSALHVRVNVERFLKPVPRGALHARSAGSFSPLAYNGISGNFTSVTADAHATLNGNGVLLNVDSSIPVALMQLAQRLTQLARRRQSEHYGELFRRYQRRRYRRLPHHRH